MKKLFLIIIATVQSALFLLANNPPLDERVSKSFHTIFKEAENTVWVTHEKYNDVSFKVNDMPMRARFDNEGNLTILTRYYEENKLPVFVKQKLNREYKGFQIYGITELSGPEIFSYTIAMRSDKKITVVVTDINGSVVSERKFKRGDI